MSYPDYSLSESDVKFCSWYSAYVLKKGGGVCPKTYVDCDSNVI